MTALQLQAVREKMNAALVEMRRFGISISETREKGDGAKGVDGLTVAELEDRFGKANADFLKHKADADRLETLLQAERAIAAGTQVVNALPASTHGASGAMEALAAVGGAPAEHAASVVAGAHREAMMAYFRRGDRAAREILSARLGPQEAMALLTTSGELGGFLVTPDFRAKVIQNAFGLAALRQMGAQVVPTNSNPLVFPSMVTGTDPYASGVSGAWRAEGSLGLSGTAATPQNQPTFGQIAIPIQVWMPDPIVVSAELLEDSVVPLESVLTTLIGKTFGLDEDSAYINGSGIGQPRGLMNYVAAASGPAISAVNSGAAADFTYGGIIDLVMSVPIQYRAAGAFLCRSAAFGNIMKLKDSQNRPIWQPGSIPDMLFGKKVHFSEFMPAVGANTYPLLFGDASQYCIAERADLRILRLMERYAPGVGFQAMARRGGGLLVADAFRAQKMST